VLIAGRVGTTRSMGPQDLTRNGIDHAGSVLYGVDPGAPEHCAAHVRIPGRQTWVYTWRPAERRGVLQPLVCPGDRP
jgi:hypothetical protein